jgi:hypothetical protein
MVEVAVFLGQATAAAGNSQFKSGCRYAVVAFLRQEQHASPDWASAERQLAARGWTEIEFSKASHGFPAENLNSVHPHAGASYEDALRQGFAAIVFSPEESAP